MKLVEMNSIHNLLRNITRSVTVTRQRVQDLAIQACLYSIIHGDITVGVKLLEAVSINKSLRKDSLVAYLEKHGNFAWMKADKTLAFYGANTTGAQTAEQEALMLSSKWDEAKKEAAITSRYDMEEEVRKFVARMHKLVKDGNIVIEHPEALAVVEQSFNRWSAETTLKSMKVDQDVVDTGTKALATHEAKTTAMADAYAAAEQNLLASTKVTIPAPVAVAA